MILLLWMLALVVLLALCVQEVASNASGAPSSVCGPLATGELTPNHGPAVAGQGTGGFVFIVPPTYRAGVPVTVQINGTIQFKGIAMQAYNLARTAAVGSFAPPSTNYAAFCSGSSGITHVNSNLKGPNVQFTFTPPQNPGSGTIFFKVTMVQSRMTFWTFTSSNLNEITTGPPTALPTAPTNVTLSSINTTSFTAAWIQPLFAQQLLTSEIDVMSNGSSTWVNISRTAYSACNSNITCRVTTPSGRLSPGWNYTVGVRVTNALGSSPRSALILLTMPSTLAGSAIIRYPAPFQIATISNSAGNSTVVRFNWANLFDGQGYTLLTYELQVSMSGSWSTVYNGAATDFTYQSSVSLWNETLAFGARVRATSTVAVSDFIKLNITITPPSVCPGNCNNRGACVDSVCQCFDGFLGPNCNFTDIQTLKLSPDSNVSVGLTLSTRLDGDRIHFRLTAQTSNWIAIDIGVGSDGMSGLISGTVGDVAVVTFENGVWTVVDANAIGKRMPEADLQQNLANVVAWFNGTTLVGTWTRFLNTSDSIEDVVITPGFMTASWAVGMGPSIFQGVGHNPTSDYRSKFVYDFTQTSTSSSLIHNASNSTCPGNCTNRGICQDSFCLCDAGFLGPACNITDAQTQVLSPLGSSSFFTLSTRMVGNMVHFRMSANTDYWIALDIGVGTNGMSPDGGGNGDVVAVSMYPSGSTNLAVLDMYTILQTSPLPDTQQNLLYAVAWRNGSTLIGTWSRAINTGDSQDIAILPQGTMVASWAIGLGTSILSSIHGTSLNERSRFTWDFSLTGVNSTSATSSITSCPSNCTNRGACQNGYCLCEAGFVGPACNYTDSQTVILSPSISLTLSTRMDGNVVHFRLSAMTSTWIAIDIGVGTNGMSPDNGLSGDVVAVSIDRGVWSVIDMNVVGRNFPLKDAQQNLMYAVAWRNGSTLIGTWSRLVNTGDSQDTIITSGMMSSSWSNGVGTSIFFSAHGPNVDNRGRFNWDYTYVVPAPTPAPSNSSNSTIPTLLCMNNCSGRGTCQNGLCLCNIGIIGPACNYTDARTQELSPLNSPTPLTLSTRIDGNLVHFRLSAASLNWIALDIGVGSNGMSPDPVGIGDVTAVTKEFGQWVVWDMNVNGRIPPIKDAQQNLMYAVAWRNGSTLIGTWSRLLNTGDADDTIIVPGSMSSSWAIGRGESVSLNSQHGTSSNDRGRFSWDYTISSMIPAPAPLPATNFSNTTAPSCLSNCSGHGSCQNSLCLCDAGYLGPACNFTDFQVQRLSPLSSSVAYSLSTRMDGNVVHFRISAETPTWIALDIGVGSNGMNPAGGIGDVIAVTNENGQWVVLDMNVGGQVAPTKDAQQNLMYAVAWRNGSTLIGTWSRLLNTGDAQDTSIVPGFLSSSWSVGLGTSIAFSAHGTSSNDRGRFSWDYTYAGSVPTSIPAPAPATNSNNGCNGRGLFQNGICLCDVGFLGPACNFTEFQILRLSPLSSPTPITLCTHIDGNVVHFRLSAVTSTWIALDIGVGKNGMSPDTIASNGDVVAITIENGQWVVLDMHVGGQVTPTKDAQQSLMNAVAWRNGSTLIGTWSRLLDTGDSQDTVITAGYMSSSWAIGFGSSIFFQSHGNTSNDRGRFLCDFTYIPPPPSQSPSIPSNSTPSCPSNCNYHGTCINSICLCDFGYMGASCVASAKNVITGSDSTVTSVTFASGSSQLTLSTLVEGDIVNFRLTAQTSNWIALDIGVGKNGMSPDDSSLYGDVVAITQEYGKWVIWDMHVKGTNFPFKDSSLSNLLNAVAWSNGSALIGTWSRRLNTGDNIYDRAIPVGSIECSWAVGAGSSILGSKHGSTSSDRGRFSFNFVTGTADIPRAFSPWLLLMVSFILPSTAMVMILSICFSIDRVARSRWGRFFEYGRPQQLLKRETMFEVADFASFGALRMVQEMTYGERTVLSVYLLAHVAFFVVASQVYAESKRDFLYCLGYLSSINLAFVMLPVSRNSVWTSAFGLPFERAIKWHRIFVFGFFLSIVLHLSTMVNKFTNATLLLQAPTNEGKGNVYGVLAAIFFAPLFALSQDFIRRKYFEVFIYSHQFFFLGLIFAFLHSSTAFCLGIGPFCLHIIDRILREWKSRRKVARLVDVQVLAASVRDRFLTVIKLNIPGFQFKAGEFCFINIPGISKYEWHPFSISTSPNDNGDLSFHVLCKGDNLPCFASRLVVWARHTAPTLLASSNSNSVLGAVKIDGPYGRVGLGNYRLDYSHIVLCAGGVGVTPMMSILGELYWLYKLHVDKLAHVRAIHLIWVNASDEPVHEWYPELLVNVLNVGDPFQLHLYVTYTRKPSDSIFAPKPDVIPNTRRGSIEMSELTNRSATPSLSSPSVRSDSVELELDSDELAAVSTTHRGGIDFEKIEASAEVTQKFQTDLIPIDAGRPDFLRIFGNIWRDANGVANSRVACLACGPNELIADVRRQAAAFQFDFHNETYML